MHKSAAGWFWASIMLIPFLLLQKLKLDYFNQFHWRWPSSLQKARCQHPRPCEKTVCIPDQWYFIPIVLITSIMLIMLIVINYTYYVYCYYYEAPDDDSQQTTPGSALRKKSAHGLELLSNGVVSMRSLELNKAVPTKTTQIKFSLYFLTFMFSHFLIFAVSEEDCHVPKAYAHMRAHARTCSHMILLWYSTEIQSVWSVHSTVPHVSKFLRIIADIGSHSCLFRPTWQSDAG